ncbi:MAG: hypothetical protein O2871_02720 [bacterium]|nr:hypothetical protein [bacterium]
MPIEKTIYDNRKPLKIKPIKKLKEGGPVQLEFDFDKPKPKPKPSNNILNFPIPSGSPIDLWFKKTNKEFTIESKKELASVDDVAPYLSKFYSERQIKAMSEAEMLEKLQELIDKGVI